MKFMISLKTQQCTILLIYGILMVGVLSCREQCENPNANMIRVKFFDITTLLEDTLTFDRVQGISATITAENPILFDTSQVQTVFELPISSRNDRVAFLFERGSGNKLIQDTISFAYSRALELIKPNCEVTELISNLHIIGHSFDSATVVSDVLSNSINNVNVHVFIQN